MPVLHIAYEKLSNGQFNFTMGVFLFRLNYQLWVSSIYSILYHSRARRIILRVYDLFHCKSTVDAIPFHPRWTF